MSDLPKSAMSTSRPSPSLGRSGDGRSAQRKPNPSPLQVSQISTPTADRFTTTSPKEMDSPHSPYGGSAPSYSPRSPHHSPIYASDPNQSPKERLQAFLAAERPPSSTSTPRPDVLQRMTGSPSTTPTLDAYPKLRNVSAPILPTSARAGSPSQSSTATGGTALRPGGGVEPRLGPRTASIDSTMSTASSATSQSLQDPTSPTPSEIALLLSSAGSPQAAIHQLLKEKKQAAAQSAQLWRLMNKQRTLVLGLNKDLERALQDKERYRKKLKEYLAQAPAVPPQPAEALQKPTPAESPSPVPSDSPDELPIQRHSVRAEVSSSIGDIDRVTKRQYSQPSVDPAPYSSPTLPTVTESKKSSPYGIGFTNGTGNPRSFPLDKNETSPRSIHTQPPPTPIRLIETHKQTKSNPEDMIPPKTPDADNVAARGSFTARRSITTPRKGPDSPLSASTPTGEDGGASSPATRKAPPAPLNLRQAAQVVKPVDQLGPDDHSESEYEEVVEVDEIPAFERGRKKTREEDDKERELVLVKEQESRSQSKKDKSSKPGSKSGSKTAVKQSNPDPVPPVQPGPLSPSIRAFSPDESAAALQKRLLSPDSLAGVLSRPQSHGDSMSERSVISPFPLSPGLPVSPRPSDRLMNSPPPRLPRDGTNMYLSSPPLSPRGMMSSPPLSPRPPRHPIPLPPHTPMSLTSPEAPKPEKQNSDSAVPRRSEDSRQKEPGPAPTPEDRSASAPRIETRSITSDGIYRGLVSDAYPDLLLPPNALPSILVKVTSTRLKPSRHSTMNLRGPDEEPVFTLGISARSDVQQLWRVEKSIHSLPTLDHQLKQACKFSGKLPDRSLFSGHAPAKLDARRKALEQYFETILDTPMDEKAALLICQYLSTHVIQADEVDGSGGSGRSEPYSTTKYGPDGRMIKEGFLTKRGKNFGGWKARFFVLDDSTLRYYDSPSGSLLGTIRLLNAQIGRQSPQSSSRSPSRSDETDSQFRHAFLILEPKRKDSSSVVRHVLCAENDEERDQWVEALLQYVSGHSPGDDRPRPQIHKTDSDSSKQSAGQARKRFEGNEDAAVETQESENADGLRGVSYEETVPAQLPARSLSSRKLETPSPMSGTFNHNQAPSSKVISGPTNGGVIHNAGAWGNKKLDSPKAKEKEQKKRSIWNFRDKVAAESLTTHSNDSNIDLSKMHQERAANIRPVFGLPLAEAVEYCTAAGSDVPLPAVVYRCLEYLEAKDAFNEEGIFRLSGSNVVIKALRERFNTEGDLDFLADGHYYDVHAIASLLKMYLRELPTTVLTRELHLDFLQVLGRPPPLPLPSLPIKPPKHINTNSSKTDLDTKDSKIAAYNALVHKLPLPNWTLLRALSAFLISVTNNHPINKMPVRNVGIVFAPTLNIPAPIFSHFLTDFDAIFTSEPDPAALVTPSMGDKGSEVPLTPEDIRSPRRQLFSDIPTPSNPDDGFPRLGAGVTYEEVRREGLGLLDTGFVPLQPSYEEPRPLVQGLARAGSGGGGGAKGDASSLTLPGPEYGVVQRTLAAPGVRDAKARRRESSMLVLGVGPFGRLEGGGESVGERWG